MEDSVTPWQQYKKNLGETRPWDFVNPNTNFVSDEDQTLRFDICKACPEFIPLTTQCKKCGCIMKFKTKLERASCPIEKW